MPTLSDLSPPNSIALPMVQTETMVEIGGGNEPKPAVRKGCTGICSKCKACPRKAAARRITVTSGISNSLPNLRTPAANEQAIRPRVALVLSGGGAKSAAHLGVINVLNRAGIAIDSVVASSAGSLVGLFYCFGYTPTELLSMMQTEMIPSRWWRWIPGSDFSRLLYLLRGGGLTSLIRRRIATCQIEDLPKKLTVMATDIAMGRSVSLTTGDVGSAVLASMSLPGLAAPVSRNGQLLIDGSLTNDLPVDIAKKQGADIVLAVDLNQPAINATSQNSCRSCPSTSLWHSLSLPILELNRIQGVQADVLVRPQLGPNDWTNFSKLNEIAALGETAAHAAMPLLLERIRAFETQNAIRK